VMDYCDNQFGVTQYRSMGDNLMRINSKLSGALEAYRKGDEEAIKGNLEDAFMLCFALMVAHNQNALGIIAAKLSYNRSRPYKHGKKF